LITQPSPQSIKFVRLNKEYIKWNILHPKWSNREEFNKIYHHCVTYLGQIKWNNKRKSFPNINDALNHAKSTINDAGNFDDAGYAEMMDIMPKNTDYDTWCSYVELITMLLNRNKKEGKKIIDLCALKRNNSI